MSATRQCQTFEVTHSIQKTQTLLTLAVLLADSLLSGVLRLLREYKLRRVRFSNFEANILRLRCFFFFAVATENRESLTPYSRRGNSVCRYSTFFGFDFGFSSPTENIRTPTVLGPLSLRGLQPRSVCGRGSFQKNDYQSRAMSFSSLFQSLHFIYVFVLTSLDIAVVAYIQ